MGRVCRRSFIEAKSYFDRTLGEGFLWRILMRADNGNCSVQSNSHPWATSLGLKHLNHLEAKEGRKQPPHIFPQLTINPSKKDSKNKAIRRFSDYDLDRSFFKCFCMLVQTPASQMVRTIPTHSQFPLSFLLSFPTNPRSVLFVFIQEINEIIILHIIFFLPHRSYTYLPEVPPF